MAVSIGVQLKWFQATGSTPHFDISKAKRAIALHAEAIELDRVPFVAVMKRIRLTWPHSEGRWRL